LLVHSQSYPSGLVSLRYEVRDAAV
jgi:hypothetical protein